MNKEKDLHTRVPTLMQKETSYVYFFGKISYEIPRKK